MAAAEYYNTSANTSGAQIRPSQPQYQTSSNQFQPASQLQMQFQANSSPGPPPYTAQDARPGVHFAPTPTEATHQHRPSLSGQPGRPSSQSVRPNFSPQNSSYYRPPPQQFYDPQYSQSNMQLQPPRLQQGSTLPPSQSHNSMPAQKPNFLSPYGQSYAQPNASTYSLDSAGYSSDPESRRRRHRRHHRDSQGSSRDLSENRTARHRSRSTNAEAYVGASAGGLIGDLIFPGLGTLGVLGGAAAGWFGGKEVGKRSRDHESKRDREQREWLEKWRPHGSGQHSGQGSHHSSRRHSHDRRDSHGSTQLGEVDSRYDRRGSYEDRRY